MGQIVARKYYDPWKKRWNVDLKQMAASGDATGFFALAMETEMFSRDKLAGSIFQGCLYGLAEMNTPEAMHVMRTALSSRDFGQLSASALVEKTNRGDEEALALLIQGAADGSKYSRLYCTAGLAALCRSSAHGVRPIPDGVEQALWAALVNALPGGCDPSRSVAREAMAALDALHGEGSTKQFIKEHGEAAAAARARTTTPS